MPTVYILANSALILSVSIKCHTSCDSGELPFLVQCEVTVMHYLCVSIPDFT